jgi:hypothetical protein
LVAILKRYIQLTVGSYCTYNGFVVLRALCIKLQFIIYLANPVIVNLNVCVGVVSAWHVFGLRMEERPPAMEVSCEYIE